MPFTLSHPAAVIPFCRGRLVPSALVIGSMAPDAPYFLGMADLRGITHEPLGLVTVDLALGIVLFVGFHALWKPGLLALAPAWAYARLKGPAAGFRLRMAGWVPVSILIGAITHLFWDGFTHLHHSFAGQLPWLVTTSWGGLELFRWLQYASGVGGVAVIAWWAVRWFRTAPVLPEEAVAGDCGEADTPVQEMQRHDGDRSVSVEGGEDGDRSGEQVGVAVGSLFALVGATCLGAALGSVVLINQEGPRTFHVTLVNAVEGAIAGMALALTVSGCVDRVRRTRLNA
ncbi:DUF4184 family protein [Actinomadura barringtoniae]|uniref:DUF4184 family protein n=1 Tax=Actinomadura barringtoniae TaxID=1427535 RepID=A0A939PMF1_9ACTN|nr:DUF4184 family protein [Actinomadura barringtoniae]MBO2454985.1 DUF4184 family protein [Actinomadura barringtoniae]